MRCRIQEPESRDTTKTRIVFGDSRLSLLPPSWSSPTQRPRKPPNMDSSDQSAKAKSPSASSSAGTSPGAIPFPPVRTNSQSSIHKSGHVSHRQSFAENLRNPPPSPRAQRHPSFTQQAIQELLLNHPPTNRHPNPRFAGRDWRDVSLGELASQDDVKWANMDTSVEEATMVSSFQPIPVAIHA